MTFGEPVGLDRGVAEQRYAKIEIDGDFPELLEAMKTDPGDHHEAG